MERRSIRLGGREWRTAVDPPRPEELERQQLAAQASELAAVFAAATAAKTMPADLGAKLVAICQRARQAYPSLVVDRELVCAIAARSPETDVDAYLERCHPGDLALALAASRGVPAAVRELERAYRPTIDSTCRRFAGPTHTADALKQLLCAKLFAAEPGKLPKLADYAGQGSLESWLRVTAVRMFLDLADNRRAPTGDDAPLAIEPAYREAVAAAMHHAATRLLPGDRHLLRQHLVAGRSLDQLAAVLGIHSVIAARRIARARKQLATDTRAELADRLALEAHALDAIVELATSDAALAKLLTPGTAP